MGTEGLKVQCNGCRKVLHVTTDKYDPDIPPNGSMVRLIQPWARWNWSAFDDQGEALSTTPAVMMTCPACSAPLVLNGKLTIIKEEFKCEICGKEFNFKIALIGHMRSHQMAEAEKDK